MSEPAGVVLDTNVFVGAGFRRGSASRAILERVRAGQLRLIWNETTRSETERILRQIPPLRWDDWSALFREDGRHDSRLEPERYDFVSGALDREFLALAEAATVPLVSSDRHLLDHRQRARVPVMPPGEFVRRLEG